MVSCNANRQFDEEERSVKKWISLCVIMMLAISVACSIGESGANVEVIRMDGISVVMFTPEETIVIARGLAQNGTSEEDNKKSFALPKALTIIEKEAFVGIAATRIEVTENVVRIEANAFAGCKNLREFIVPATVKEIDDTALNKCKDVIVYGVKGTEAERFAGAAGFRFVDLKEDPEKPEQPEGPVEKEKKPVELPIVPRN